MVALFTGAWIETYFTSPLKKTYLVALFTGAWIETAALVAVAAFLPGRALYGRVD